MLMIGERLRTIRESKNLSQGDIEQRTGMLRCYTSTLWPSTRRRSKFRCISFSMMVMPSQRRSKG